MRRALFALAAVAAMFTGGSLLTTQAQAAPLGSPSAIQEGVADVSPATEVRYVCRLVRTRFGLRRNCFWTPNRVYARPFYRPYRGYRVWRGGRRWRY